MHAKAGLKDYAPHSPGPQQITTDFLGPSTATGSSVQNYVAKN